MSIAHLTKLCLLPAALLSVPFAAMAANPPQAAPSPVAHAKTSAAAVKTVPLAKLGVSTPFYFLDGTTALYRLDPATHARQRISEHDFTNAPMMARSADARWIAYGAVTDSGPGKIWLYDTQAGSDRLAFEAPAWESLDVSFSPDGSRLAVVAVADSKRPSGVGTTIEVIDTATLRQVPVKLPGTTPFVNGMAGIRWSADGKELLFHLWKMEGQQHVREFYSWHEADGQVETISGAEVQTLDGIAYKRGDSQIAVAPQVLVRWLEASGDAATPNGSLHAHVTVPDRHGNYALVVQAGDGAARQVARGKEAGCGDDGLQVLGWLDDRYLVYENQFPHFFVYDALEGQQAALFERKDALVQFTW